MLKISEKARCELLGIINAQVMLIEQHRKKCSCWELKESCPHCLRGLNSFVSELKRKI